LWHKTKSMSALAYIGPDLFRSQNLIYLASRVTLLK
jgi:hypothetical protein